MKKLILITIVALFTVSLFNCSPTSINKEDEISRINPDEDGTIDDGDEEES